MKVFALLTLVLVVGLVSGEEAEQEWAEDVPEKEKEKKWQEKKAEDFCMAENCYEGVSLQHYFLLLPLLMYQGPTTWHAFTLCMLIKWRRTRGRNAHNVRVVSLCTAMAWWEQLCNVVSMLTREQRQSSRHTCFVVFFIYPFLIRYVLSPYDGLSQYYSARSVYQCHLQGSQDAVPRTRQGISPRQAHRTQENEACTINFSVNIFFSALAPLSCHCIIPRNGVHSCTSSVVYKGGRLFYCYLETAVTWLMRWYQPWTRIRTSSAMRASSLPLPSLCHPFLCCIHLEPLLCANVFSFCLNF